MRAFPAHGSRTELSVLLTPVLPNCTSPSQAVTSLVHLIAETRAPNRRKTASFKLPFVEPQMNTCDNCTTRKSAPFQARANLEPLCGPLQATIRFFRVLVPAPSTASLASHLPPRPKQQGTVARSRVFHVPILTDPYAPPSSDSTLLCHRPLRTVRETFASYGSSPAEISHRRYRFIGKPSCPFIFASYCTA